MKTYIITALCAAFGSFIGAGLVYFALLAHYNIDHEYSQPLEQALYDNIVETEGTINKPLSPAKLLQYHHINKAPVAKIPDNQANVQASINIAERCDFTGSMRREKSITFYVNCQGFKESLRFDDDGLLTNFVIEKGTQKKSIYLIFYNHNPDNAKTSNTSEDNNAQRSEPDMATFNGSAYPTADVMALFSVAMTAYPELKKPEIKALIILSRDTNKALNQDRFLFLMKEYMAGKLSASILSLSTRAEETKNPKSKGPP